MKRKLVTALLAGMSLTMCNVGTAYADTSVEKKDGYVWVTDKESWIEDKVHEEEGHWEDKLIKDAWEETIEHEEEGHMETVVLQPEYVQEVPVSAEIGHSERVTVVDKEAWTETINHPEEGHTEIIKHPAVTDDVWVVDKPAVYEQVWVVDKEAWDEVVKHPAETHEEWVVDKAAWVEKVEHPAETHEEFQWVVDVPAVTDFIKHPAVTEDKWVVDKEAWTEVVKHEAEYEKVWVVDKEAWTEKIKHDAEGHWELVKTTTKPVTTPEKTEEKGSLQNDNKDADQIPKTGDMTSFSSLIALAGSTLIATGATYKLRKKSKK